MVQNYTTIDVGLLDKLLYCVLKLIFEILFTTINII